MYQPVGQAETLPSLERYAWGINHGSVNSETELPTGIQDEGLGDLGGAWNILIGHALHIRQNKKVTI